MYRGKKMSKAHISFYNAWLSICCFWWEALHVMWYPPSDIICDHHPHQCRSVQSLDRLSLPGDLKVYEQIWHGQECPAFSLQTTVCTPTPTPNPNKVHWRMVLERLSWHVTCPNHASFCLLTVARRGSCRPTRKLILLRTQPLVLCSKLEMRRRLLGHLVSKAWILFFRVSKGGPCFIAVEEDGGDKRLAELELPCRADGVTPPDPV